MSLTLEQFRATKREVEDLGQHIDGLDYDGKIQPGYVYDYEGVSGYIELHDGGRKVFLILGNEDWLEDPSELPKLEQHLYEWMHTEVGA